MKKLDMSAVARFVNENIVTFHEAKLHTLEALDLKTLLRRKNPYLFKAKNVVVASELIQGFLDALLSSSEERLFGDFLEELAIFVSERTSNGRKSGIEGIDLEFARKGIHHLVSIKSGPNWGNNAQQKKQEQDFQRALKVFRQSRRARNVQPLLGICYGRQRTTQLRGYLKVVGQNFWYLISGNPELYTQIVEPLGHRAKEHNDQFREQLAGLANRLTAQFIKDFCSENGAIDWKRLVQFNSGNLDLKQ